MFDSAPLLGKATDEHHIVLINGKLQPGTTYEIAPRANSNLDLRERAIREMKGSVHRYDDPFGPAVDPNDWDLGHSAH